MGKIRTQRKGLTIGRHGLGKRFLALKEIAEVDIGLGEIGP